jgi:large subunit ribosomal protein L17
MRKRIQGRTLSRNATQRKALKRTMLVSLVNSGSIKTTLAKAKELKPFAERMITRAKKVKSGDNNSLIVVIRQLKKDMTMETAKKLIIIAKDYKDRKGGYLRIIKLAPRKSDSAEIAILQWVAVKVDKKKTIEKKEVKSKSKTDKKSINNKPKADQSKSGKSDK